MSLFILKGKSASCLAYSALELLEQDEYIDAGGDTAQMLETYLTKPQFGMPWWCTCGQCSHSKKGGSKASGRQKP